MAREKRRSARFHRLGNPEDYQADQCQSTGCVIKGEKYMSIYGGSMDVYIDI